MNDRANDSDLSATATHAPEPSASQPTSSPEQRWPPATQFYEALVERVTLGLRDLETKNPSTFNTPIFLQGLYLGLGCATLVELVKQHPELHVLGLDLADRLVELNLATLLRAK